MTTTQTSTTAKGIAAMRAIETEKGAERSICVDHFARRLTTNTFYFLSKWFAGYGERRAPGTQGFIVCRCRYFDDYLRECIRSGLRQIVILGAGLDSRAYRQETIEARAKVFEVDHPATQASKIARMKKVLGTITPSVVFVPLDFNKETLDKLLDAGFDRGQRTLFIWEGVTYYLEPAAVDATLSWIRTNAAPASRVIFDYMYASALTAGKKRGEVKRMQRYQRFTGEGLVYGIEKGQITEFMSRRGFKNIVDADSDKLRKLYCTGANLERRVAEIYAIVYAEMG
jgi:methyltransferase (TIGR00027 family)